MSRVQDRPDRRQLGHQFIQSRFDHPGCAGFHLGMHHVQNGAWSFFTVASTRSRRTPGCSLHVAPRCALKHWLRNRLCVASVSRRGRSHPEHPWCPLPGLRLGESDLGRSMPFHGDSVPAFAYRDQRLADLRRPLDWRRESGLCRLPGSTHGRRELVVANLVQVGLCCRGDRRGSVCFGSLSSKTDMHGDVYLSWSECAPALQHPGLQLVGASVL